VATGKALVWDRRKVFEIFVLVAAAMVMTAAVFDMARGTEASPTPVVEREVIPGADQLTSAQRDAYRRHMEAAAAPEEKARIRAVHANAADKNAPVR